MAGADPRLAEAERIERRDPARAALIAADVLAALGERTDPESRALSAQALVQRGRALLFLRELEAAMEVAARACATAEQPDTLVRARTLFGHLLVALGHEEAAIEVLTETLAEARLRGAGRAARAACHLALGSALRRAERFDEAIAPYREAEAVARADGDRVALANVLVNIASAGWQCGRLEEATLALRESRRLYEAEGRPELLVWQDAIEAWVEGEACRSESAIARAQAALANGASLEVEAKVSATRALAHALSRPAGASPADLARARALLEGLAADARTRGWAGDLPIIARELSAVCARLGDHEAGLRWCETAFDARRAADDERRRRRLTAEAFRLRVARVEIEAEQARLRTQALEAINAELEAVGRERATLLSTVAHDLRSQLTAILLSLEHHRRNPGRGPEELLASIQTAVQIMTEVVDGALSTEAIRTGRAPLRRRDVDVVDVVRRVCSGLRSAAERKHIVLSLDEPGPVVVSTDDRALARVVENIVSNALKFTPPDLRVQVSVQADADRVHVEVRDDGPGFDPAEREAVFELGRQGAARPTSGEPSTGVGLHVVRDLVHALGGAVELGNRTDGGGARVVVTLPVHVGHA